jgi:hypothetical protein
MVQFQTPAPRQSLMRYQTPYTNKFSSEEIRAQQSLQPANIRRNIRLKTAFAQGIRNNYREIAMSALPIGVAGRFGRIGTGIKNIFGRATTNPFAGVTLKEFGKKAIGKVAGIYSLATGFEAVRSAQAGDKFNPLGLKTLQTATGFALSNPLVGGLGAVTGLTQRGFQTAQKNMSIMPDISKNIPNFPTVSPSFNFASPEIPQFQTPALPQFGSPSVSSSYTAPAVYVSGGGGGGIPPELLALLIAGVGGYAIGRRRKKKKKKSKKGRN